jgi:RND family efflux transporter MFP subunit
MKRIVLALSILLALTLAACGTASTPTAIPTLVLNAQPSITTTSSNSVSASGQVIPVQYVQLSFPLTGVVKTVNVKAGDSVKAGQTLVTLDTAILESNVKVADANLTAVQSQYNYLKRVGTDQDHLASAQSDVDRAQASLDSAKSTLAQATLVAPFDGTIAAVDISQAETVIPGQVVIMLGDLAHFEVETTDLSEKDVPDVQVGQAANVTVRALNKSFTGKVTDVSRVASTLGGDVVFKVTIGLDEQPDGLRWGMSADVRIETK